MEGVDSCEAAFAEILRVIERNGYTSKCRQLMTCLLPKQFRDRAEAVMSDDTVVLTVARESRRSAWVVHTKQQEYVVFIDPGNWYCSCPSYTNQVMKEGKLPFCKHVLAALIFDARRKHGDCRELTINEISDTDFTHFLSRTVQRATSGHNHKSNQ